MTSKELKDKYIYSNNNITPYGYKIWSILTDAIKTKFESFSYQEGYYFDNFFDIELEDEGRIQMNNIVKNNNLIHASSASSLTMIEGAKTLAIDILQAYISVTKNVLGINLISGKKVSFDEREIYVIGGLSKNNEFIEVGKVSFLGKINNSYRVTSEFSSKILDVLVETTSDEEGLVISPLGAPIQIGIVPLKMNEAKVIPTCKNLEEKLIALGYRVELDLSKNKEQDKLNSYIEKGIPLIIEVGPRDILNNQVEIIKRTDKKSLPILNDRLDTTLANFIKKVNVDIFNNQIRQVLLNSVNVLDKEELLSSINNCKICNVIWNGDADEYNKIASLKDDASIMLPFNQELFDNVSILDKTKARYVLSVMNSSK